MTIPKKINLCLSVLLATTALSAQAEYFNQQKGGSYYKWVDGDGKVHYSESRPPPNTASKDIEAIKAPRVDKDENPEPSMPTSLPTEKREPKAREASKENKPAAEPTQKDNCKVAQENLRLLSTSGKLRVQDPAGEAKDLAPKERAAQKAENEAYLQQNCETPGEPAKK